MEKPINFFVNLEKDDQPHQANITIEEGQENNQQLDIEKSTIATAKEKYGDDLEGLKVNISLNLNDKTADDKFINETVSLAQETNPNLDVAKLEAETQQAMSHFKHIEREFFPGYEDKKHYIPDLENGYVEQHIYNTIYAQKDAQYMAFDAARNINDGMTIHEHVEKYPSWEPTPTDRYPNISADQIDQIIEENKRAAHREIGMALSRKLEREDKPLITITDHEIAEGKKNIENLDREQGKNPDAENEKIPFDATYTKDGQSSTHRVDVEEIHYHLFSARDNPKILDGLKKSISSVKNDVISKAIKLHGKDLNGLEVKIRPNFHKLVEKEANIKDYFAKIEAEYEGQPEELAAARGYVDKTIEYYKSQNAKYFPGTKNSLKKDMTNPIIEEAFVNITGHYPTVDMVKEVEKDIHKILKGYEFTHNNNTKANEQAYFVVMKKADGQEIAKSISIDKTLSTKDQKEIVKGNAQAFVSKNIQSYEQLEGIDVRLERAKDLSDSKQREFYKEIGHNQNIKGLQNSFEIGK